MRICAAAPTNVDLQPPSFTKAGYWWAWRTNQVEKWVISKGWKFKVRATAAIDAEPAWDPPFRATNRFVAAFDRTARHSGWKLPPLLWDFGSLEPGYWSPNQEWIIAAGGDGVNHAMPEIYYPGMAREWSDLSAYALRQHGRRIRFGGVTSQWAPGTSACGYSPARGVGQLLAALKVHPGIQQKSVAFVTDFPCASSAAASSVAGARSPARCPTCTATTASPAGRSSSASRRHPRRHSPDAPADSVLPAANLRRDEMRPRLIISWLSQSVARLGVAAWTQMHGSHSWPDPGHTYGTLQGHASFPVEVVPSEAVRAGFHILDFTYTSRGRGDIVSLTYVVPGGGVVEVYQGTQSTPSLLRVQTGGARERAVVRISGRRWRVFRDDRTSLVGRFPDGVTVVVSGAGPLAQERRIAGLLTSSFATA